MSVAGQSPATMSPGEMRERIRAGHWRRNTAGTCMGYVQTNLVILPQDAAFDFMLFTHRNPRPCPLLDVTEPGSPHAEWAAPGADLRVDVPRYRVYRNGRMVGEVDHLLDLWRDDLVAFLIGCSYTMERALQDAGVPVKHIDMGRNVSMYLTSIPCRPAGRFQGNMVVSMRPIPYPHLVTAVEVTARFPRAHGAPIHMGDPAAIGVSQLDEPDYGDSVPVAAGELPVFWACGVTPQAVALASGVEFMITHAPGHMLITDLHDSQLEER